MIDPNGFERLDDTPPLAYPFAPPDQFSWALTIGSGTIGLVALSGFLWWFARRRPRPTVVSGI